MELAPVLVEQLIFGPETHRRRTQDSPVLPDVWAYYATPSAEPGRHEVVGAPNGRGEVTIAVPLDLLLTPHRNAGPAKLAHQVRRRLDLARGDSDRESARIAYSQSHVVARLYFDEVIQVLLPLTAWWRDFVWNVPYRDEDGDNVDDCSLWDVMVDIEPEVLVVALEEWGRTQTPVLGVPLRPAELWSDGEERLADDLLWMVRLVGAVEWGRRLTQSEAEAQGVTVDAYGRISSLPLRAARDENSETGVGRSIDYWPIVETARELMRSDLAVREPGEPSLWLVNRNRKASRAVKESRRAIKADAATHLFGIDCRRLTWAIVDSGVDAKHPAFLEPLEDGSWERRTRIERTYDFTRLRLLLDQEVVRELLESDDILEQSFGDRQLDAQIAPIRMLIHREDEVDSARQKGGANRLDPSRGRLRIQLGELRNRLETGREIDWELLDPLLRVYHDETYDRPLSSHGTHVAGILAANWKKHELQGICPDIRLYDLRVLDPLGPNDEFAVLGALQFIQYINKQREGLTIHGANLSLSIRHEVTNYACGRTPVCEECERLVASGVVVVAAGGNAGWDDELARVAPGAGYRVVSITDPGNAEAVITVGATHRDRPHSYGVSFFSSRGPTGDGRAKPDLVAPGEKITSTVPGGSGLKREDGTSMAAPHVSGAAALLMARHNELIGRPQRIKEILCNTATDLGRERQFQGTGMLDVLRALQSV